MTLRLVPPAQHEFDHGAEARRPKTAKDTGVRGSTLRAIHATWRKICPLEGEELRDARLVFATHALGLRKPLTSTSKLSSAQLGRVLDAMREKERAPELPGVQSQISTVKSQISNSPSDAAAEIHHLATAAQVTVLEKLRKHLGWSATGFQAFIVDKFKGKHSPALLTPPEANSCTMILLTIAARKRIKDRGFNGKISRAAIHAEIPALKRALDIDVRAAADRVNSQTVREGSGSRSRSDEAKEDYDRMVKGAAFK
jgi:hypothetical protein